MKKRALPWVLLGLLLFLQAQFWFGDGSLAQQAQLKTQIIEQKDKNDALAARNDDILLDIESLGDDVENHEGIEARARADLGMVQEGEVFIMMMDPPTASADLNSDLRVPADSPPVFSE